MHSSISSSESENRAASGADASRRVRGATTVMLLLVTFVFLNAEIMARVVFPRVSRIESRIRKDERETNSIGAAIAGSPLTVLIVGNSLLLRGLDYPKLRDDMAGQANVVRFGIENTEYIDWYYGLRHLFESGVHPSSVVLCLNLGQTVSTRTLGDYSARHLFGRAELLPAAHAAGMDATRTSGLILAHWSVFYASRATIRNFVLNKTAPGYAEAMHTLADVPIPFPPDEELLAKANERLREMQQLCDRYGVPLVLLIPPAVVRHNNDLLAFAASQQRVTLDYPIPSLGTQYFADGVHLNQRGATLFTESITKCLRTRLANEGVGDSIDLSIR